MWLPKQTRLVGGLRKGQPVSQSERCAPSVPRTGTGEGDQSLGDVGHKVEGGRVAAPFSPTGISASGVRAGRKLAFVNPSGAAVSWMSL